MGGPMGEAVWGSNASMQSAPATRVVSAAPMIARSTMAHENIVRGTPHAALRDTGARRPIATAARETIHMEAV